MRKQHVDLTRRFNKLSDNVLDFIFPSHCVSCGMRRSILCPACISMLEPSDPCGSPNIFAPYAYRDPHLKKALWHFKYRNRKKFAADIAPFLADTLRDILEETLSLDAVQYITLIPAPLSKKRRRERGFNQAEELCRAIADIDDRVNFVHDREIVQKIKETSPQMSIKNRRSRLKNLTGSIELVRPMNLCDQHIVVVDDVTTTGATLKTVFTALKPAHPRSLTGLAIAH